MTSNKTLSYFKSFEEKILGQDVLDFEAVAFDLFLFQAKQNPVYKEYLGYLGIDPAKVSSIDAVPFLPIAFFKNQDVVSAPIETFKGFFSSSGTSGMVTSKHHIWSVEFYQKHCLSLFEMEYGPIQNFHVLALLPSYLERQGSSLVSMVDFLIKKSDSPDSGFYLYDHGKLAEKIDFLKDGNRKILLIGVTFALLDFAESGFQIPKTDKLIVMETGGMKGRRREMVREEVHAQLSNAFQVKGIHSEYGMTEMSSQAYSKGNGVYTFPHTTGVYLRDTNDPFSRSERAHGGLNVIDLANFHSCAFLETQDLGRVGKDGKIEILGRLDNSEIRGCNLMLN